MAEITLTGINKVYPGGTHAVHDVDLQIADGEFMIMVGPSGCAKSTILRMIAGLEVPTTGTIEIGGRVVNDVPPKDRDIAMVFQSYALYPHMTVAENMAFGLRLRKMPPTEIEQRVNEAARILGLENLLGRLPKQMSGGQRQRVAMGRAIVREPQAFLMDEPLSNLDAKLRVQMRTEIAKLHQRLGTTTVYVTHDQVEAMTLGQRICILRKGVVQQVDSPDMVYTNPANIFVGGFIGSPGMNFLAGHILVHDGTVFLQVGEHHLQLPQSVVGRLVSSTDINGRGVVVGIRPEHLYECGGNEQRPDALPVDVELMETMGSESFAYFTMNVPQPDLSELSDTQAVAATFVAKLPPATRVRAGSGAWLVPDLEHVHLFDPQTQQTLLAPIVERPDVHQAYDPTGASAWAATAQGHDHFPVAAPQIAAVQPIINLHQTFSVPAAASPADPQVAPILSGATTWQPQLDPLVPPAAHPVEPPVARPLEQVFDGHPVTGRLDAGSQQAWRAESQQAWRAQSQPAADAAVPVPGVQPAAPPSSRAAVAGLAGARPAAPEAGRSPVAAPEREQALVPAASFAVPRIAGRSIAAPSQLFHGRGLFADRGEAADTNS